MGNYFTSNTTTIEERKDKLYYLSLLENKNNENGFSLHGLWPNYSNGTYPSFCKKIPFDIEKLRPIEDKLMKYWELPKDHNKLEKKFWHHEWSKHGTCMFTPMDEFSYFSKAIELYEMVIQDKLDIELYRNGRNYMIPFDLEFNYVAKS